MCANTLFIKGTLIQIWKSLLCLCSYKSNILKFWHSESKEFSSYSPVNFEYFFKSRLIFNVFHCFYMFVNKHFAYLKWAYLKKWMKCVIMRNLLNIKTNVLQDFHIYISVRSKNEMLKKSFILNMDSEEQRVAN